MIFKNQTSIRLKLRTSINFNETPITSAKIKYIKPDDTPGEWTATVLPGGEADGDIYLDFNDEVKFDQNGKWYLWAYLVFPDGRTGIGEKVICFIQN